MKIESIIHGQLWTHMTEWTNRIGEMDRGIDKWTYGGTNRWTDEYKDRSTDIPNRQRPTNLTKKIVVNVKLFTKPP